MTDFIYEFLQNAEDAGARTVRFTLTDQTVEFEHNGKRLFSDENVESITNIGITLDVPACLRFTPKAPPRPPRRSFHQRHNWCMISVMKPNVHIKPSARDRQATNNGRLNHGT